jgi:hypothetical protein
MWAISGSGLFWSTAAIQLITVVTIVAMQLLPHGRRRAACHRFFFALLLALGLVTVLAVSVASESWVTSGASLSVMTLCATFDLGGKAQQAASF